MAVHKTRAWLTLAHRQIRTVPDGLRSRFAPTTTRPPGLSGVPGALPPQACSRRRTAPGPGRSWRLTNSTAPSARGIRTRCAGSAGARSRSTPGTWPCRSARTHRRDGRRIRPLRIPRPQASRDDSAADQIRTALPPLPVASRVRSGLKRRRGDERAVADLGQLPPAGRVPDPDAGAPAGTAGSQPGAVRAECHRPDRRAGPDATHGA